MTKWMLVGLAFASVAAAPPVKSILRPLAVLNVRNKAFDCLAFRSDGKVLATGHQGYDRETNTRWGEIKLWNLATRQVQSTWKGHDDAPSALTFSPDDKTLVSVGGKLERIHWHVATGKAVRTLPPIEGSFRTSKVLFSPSAKEVGTCGNRHSLVWDAVSGKQLFCHTRKSDSWGGVLSHDLRLAAVPEYQDVDLWDVRTGKIVQSLLDHPGSVTSLSFSANDRLLAVAFQGKASKSGPSSEVWLWDVPRGRRLRALRIGNHYSLQVVLSPSGALLAVGTGHYTLEEPELRLFETASGRELARLRLNGKILSNLTFSPDGKMLAASCDGQVRVWTVRQPGSPAARRDRK